MKKLPPDPFDHSRCSHPEPHWPVPVTEMVQIDLLRTLHLLWLDIQKGNLSEAISLIEELSRYLEMAYLGLGSEVDAEINRIRATAQEMATLKDSGKFDEELRRLMGRGE